jgi:tetratricopeptide (TPR) repeat protein
MSRDETLGYWMAIIGRERTKRKRHTEAAQAFAQAGRLAPKSLYAAHEHAWFLATCPDPAFRNGRAAIPLSARVVECWPDPNFMDTLAIAHAEAGDFARAVEIERQALERSKTWHRSKYAIDPWPAFPQLITAFSRGETYAQVAERAAIPPAGASMP